jgi:hypothetical protein
MGDVLDEKRANRNVETTQAMVTIASGLPRAHAVRSVFSERLRSPFCSKTLFIRDKD